MNNLISYLKRGKAENEEVMIDFEYRSMRTLSQSGIRTMLSSPN